MRLSLACLGLFAALCGGPYRQPQPRDATTAVLRAFDNHNIVMFGEQHACKQEYEWLQDLVSTPEFADRVDDIIVELGNSLYQKSVDRYIAGEDIPFAQVQLAWRNMIGLVGPPSPVLESFYQTVRETNLKRRGKHQLRIVLGDPYGDWDAIKTPEDWGPFVGHRDSWYAQVVKKEVLDKKRRALLIMGANHFLRKVDWGPGGPIPVEQQLRAAGARTYFIVFGTNAIGDYDDLDTRFDAWPLPAIVDLRGNWVGDLPAEPVLAGGTGFPPLAGKKLRDVADALLYVAPRDALTMLLMPWSELEGTAYGEELDRRTMIQLGRALHYTVPEAPLFRRPRGSSGSQSADQPPPPKSIHDPLPPRPPSR
jgi:hypothetical protein